MMFKKGDRVKWEWEGRIHYGTVLRKTRDQAKVVEDGCVEEQWHLNMSRLQHSDRPLPTDTTKTPMDAYSIRTFRKVGVGSDGFMYTGKIFKDSKPVLDIVDDGGGGPLLFHRVKKDDDKSLDEFFAAIKEWWHAMGGDVETSEPEGLWVDWQVNERQYGVTGKDYVTRHLQRMEELMARHKVPKIYRWRLIDGDEVIVIATSVEQARELAPPVIRRSCTAVYTTHCVRQITGKEPEVLACDAIYFPFRLKGRDESEDRHNNPDVFKEAE